MENAIRIFKSIDELSQFFARKLAARIQETPAGYFFSMALSGGSTPRLVFAYLASNFRDHIDWQKILVFWGDERCVAPESDESNFRMAKESLLDHVPIPANNIFRIRGEADPSVESDRYAEAVLQYVPSHHNIPRFDFIMLGLGEDGHTASIFPGNTHLFSSDKLFEVAENPHTKQKRITATGKLINQAKYIVFLVTGESKAEMVARVIERKDRWEKLPASMVHPENGELLWLLDNQAASKLLKT
jgi:6-phosphogluconolactonase